MNSLDPQISSVFSVLMAVYRFDDPILFDKALMSIVNNTLQPKYTVLVVDGPIGKSLQDVINKYQGVLGNRLKVISLLANQGLATALNHGLEFIDTEYVARADADDFNHPCRFQEQKKIMDLGFDLFGAAIEEMSRDGEKIAIKKVPLASKNISDYIKRRNPFNHMTVCFRTKLAKDSGGYPDLDLREDYGLWVKMIQSDASFCNSPQILVSATTGDSFYSRRGGLRSVIAEMRMQKFLYENNIKNFSQAIFDFVLKSTIFMSPRLIRKFVYEKFLRNCQTDCE
jgi:hypothetical protein